MILKGIRQVLLITHADIVMREVIIDLNHRIGFKAVFPYLLPFSLAIAEMVEVIDHSKLKNKLWLTHILLDDYNANKVKPYKYHGDIRYHKVTGEILASYLYIVQDLDDERLETHLKHELGHALGLGHSMNPFSAMYERSYGSLKSKDFDGEDIKLLRKKYLGEE